MDATPSWRRDLSADQRSTQTTFERIGPIAFGESQIVLLSKDLVEYKLELRQIKRIRMEMLPSFRHPRAGALVAAAFMIPVTIFFGDPLRIGWYFGSSIFRLLGSALLPVAGLMLMISIVRRRSIPFLIVETPVGLKEFVIRSEVPEAAVQRIMELDRRLSANTADEK